MATRNESVRLELIDEFTTPMARAAAATAALNAELERLNRSAGSRHTQATRTIVNNNQAMTRSNDQSARSINQLTGRLGLAVDAVLTLGSGLVPMGALAGQAAAGLAAMGAAAAVALGSGVLAVQGVADAVKAVQKFQDDPSIENLRAANKELDSMAPAAARFVVEFQKARPLLSDIQESAARGWFPGLTMALGELDAVAPKLEKILLQSGRMGGLLVKDGITSLGGERWDDFFKFVADEVPTAEASLARIMGDLAHGAAEMWMAFDPGNDSFIEWVEDVANGFDEWASSAEGREGIEDFLAYARDNGPKVADFLSAVGGSLLAIVKAAAPLGGPTLQALTAIAEVFESFANSDLATPLLAGLAALRLYTRAAALASTAQARLNRMMTVSATGAGARGAAGGIPLFGALSAGQRAGMTAAQQAERAAQQRSMMLKGAGMAAGVGLLASGAAGDIGLTNTAMLTLAGTMAGPWGAAAGAAAGLAMDAAAANNDLAESLKAADAAINSGDLASGLSAVADAQKKQAEFAKDMDPNDWSNGVDPGFYKNTIEGWFGKDDVEEGQETLDGLNRQIFISQHAVAGLGKAFGHTFDPLDGSIHSVHQLEKALASAKPAMDRLGISQADLTTAKSEQALIAHGGRFGQLTEAVLGTATPFDDLVERLQRTDKWMDTASARAQNYNAVLRDLANDQGTNADQADRFREAFEALVSPANDAEAALSAQVDALQAIRKLKPSGGFNERGGDNAQANAAATRDYTKAVEERIATMINAGRGESAIAGALRQSRRQFIESGVAAGFSADQMRKRANAIGLTPRLIRTTFKALGLTEFDRKVEQLRRKLKGIPSRVRTDMAANGIPQTIAEVNDLVEKYDLTDGQRTALISLVGSAQTKQDALALSAVLDAAARDRQAQITIVTNEIRRTRADNEIGRHSADGSTVPKTGLPYADRHPYLLADGEEVISNRYGQADRHRSLLKAINAGRLADGGTTGSTAPYERVAGADTLTPLARAARNAARELKVLQSELKSSSERLEKERSERADLAATIRSNFSNDPFAVDDTNVFGKGATADPLSALRRDNADLREYERTVKQLRRRGLNGDALGEADTLSEVQSLAGLSKRDLGKYERLYDQRQRLQSRAAGVYATGVTGVTPADIDRLAKHVQRVERAVLKAEKSNEQAQARSSKAVADSNRASARTASQRRRRQ